VLEDKYLSVRIVGLAEIGLYLFEEGELAFKGQSAKVEVSGRKDAVSEVNGWGFVMHFLAEGKTGLTGKEVFLQLKKGLSAVFNL
jgi:hypothetical protein